MTGIAIGSGGSGGGSLPKLSKPAEAGHILLGKEALDGRGNKISGTIASKTAASYTPGNSIQRIPAGLYLSGEQSILAVPTQAKNVSPSGLLQTILPDSGKYLRQVTVEAANLQSYDETIYASSDYGFSLSALGFSPLVFAFVLRTRWDSMEDSPRAVGGFALRNGMGSSGYAGGRLLMAKDREEAEGIYSGYVDSKTLSGISLAWGENSFSLTAEERHFRSNWKYDVLLAGF